MIRLATAQINPIVGDLENNKVKILNFVSQAKDVQSDLVVFPELALCGYPPEDLLYKKHFVIDNKKKLKEIAKVVDGITAVIGFVDIDRDNNIYNAAAVISNKEIKGVYCKEQLPNYGVFDEKRYFQPGENSHIYAINRDYFAVNICEDIWAENGIYQKQSKQGASLIVNISSSPYDMGKYKERVKLIKRRAKEVNAYICYANLVGGQDELVFDGGSFIVDPKGTIVSKGHRFVEELIVTDLNLGLSRERRYKPFDIISVSGSSSEANRKPIKTTKVKDLEVIEAVYKALVLGAKDYIQKNGFNKVLIGISGGIDSALVAAVAVDAVGNDNVIGLTMPSQFTSDGTYTDSKRLCDNLGMKCLEIPIENIYKSYESALAVEFKGSKPNVAEENIQARIRGNLLMALSNKFGWLVLTTGNKSEMAVGYCTLYGDMSGGFAVIKDVPKTIVYELSKWINAKGRELIPKSIIKRAPSAELRSNQKDQDSLPSYDELDDLLESYVERHQSLSVMAKKSGVDMAKDVIRKVDLSEYKRRQAPPGVKITNRAFGKDWRLPITNKYKEFND